MTRLMRTSEIAKRPVVTLAGEDVAQVKDIVFSAGGGSVGGFTLAGRGLFAGPKHEALAWSSVLALGADAVMITDEDALTHREAVLDHIVATGGSGGDVLGAQVLTHAGEGLGKVVDLIVQVDGGRSCDVVGYEIEASEALENSQGQHVLIPLPDTIAASGDHLIVPAAVKEFVSGDLAGFGASITAFRAQLKGTS